MGCWPAVFSGGDVAFCVSACFELTVCCFFVCCSMCAFAYAFCFWRIGSPGWMRWRSGGGSGRQTSRSLSGSRWDGHVRSILASVCLHAYSLARCSLISAGVCRALRTRTRAHSNLALVFRSVSCRIARGIPVTNGRQQPMFCAWNL